MKKYDKIKRLGHRATDGILDEGTLEIKEKLDGNNFRVSLNSDGKVIMGSRNVEFKKDREPMSLEEIEGQFQDVAEYVQENVDSEELAEIESDWDADLTLFGENMVKHTLDYDWEEIPQWLLFGAYDTNADEYLDFQSVIRIADRLGLKTVPLVDEMTTDEFREQFDPDEPGSVVPESKYREGKAEGIVIRNKENGIKAKVLTEEFKEKHRIDDGQHGQEHLPGDDTMELVNMYATDARIKKHIKKLTVDQGYNLAMELMEELPMQVVEDIFEEEYEELVRMNKTIDFKKFRSKVAKKCVANLKAEIRKQGVDKG